MVKPFSRSALHSFFATRKKTAIFSHPKEWISQLLFGFFPLLIGFLLPGAILFSTCAPFGISFLAVADRKRRNLPLLLATTLGYLIFYAQAFPLRYLLSLCALFAMKAGLYKGGDLYDSQYILPLAAGLAMALGGSLFVAAHGFLPHEVLLLSIEIILCTLAAFLFHSGMFKYLNHGLLSSYTSTEVLCFICLVSLSCLSLSAFTLGDLSLGRLLFVVFLLRCTESRNIAFCAMLGSICGLFFGLLNPSLLYLSAAYGAGGLLAGLVAPRGRFASVFAFLFSCGPLLLYLEISPVSILLLYEIIVSCLLFFLLPRQHSRFISALTQGFSSQCPASHEQKLREYCSMRLMQLSQGFKEVFETVRYVSDRLHRTTNKNLSHVIEEATDETCHNCQMCSFCWGKQYDTTMDLLLHLAPTLREKEKITAEDFPDTMAVRCVKSADLISALNHSYQRFLMKKKISDRFSLGRNLECSQFMGLATTIERMANNLKENLTFDTQAEHAIFAYLQEKDIEPLAISVLYYESGRPQIEIEIERITNFTLDQEEFLTELSAISKSPLQNLEIQNKNGHARIIATPQELYDPIYSIQTLTKSGETLSGDTATAFRGLAGQFCFALCDAMGSGKRAAIDSAMGIRVLQKVLSAGFDSDMAVRALNASIALNSEEERLTSCDIATIDLFTGSTQIVKAGAAPTYIRRGSYVQRLFSRSIPVGILDTASPEYLCATLSRGDILVMISDGILFMEEEDDFIPAILKEFVGDDTEALCQTILEAAQEKNQGKCPDDMTVMALYLS